MLVSKKISHLKFQLSVKIVLKNIKNHGQEICTRPDSDFYNIIDHIWKDKDKDCKSTCGNNTKYLLEIKKNKQYLTNLVNSKCRR